MGFKLVGDSEQKSEKQKRFRLVGESDEPEFKQSKIESVLSSGAKGLLKGAQEFGRLHDPLTNLIPGKKLDDRLEEVSDKILPSEEGFAENVAHRAGRIAPSLAIGGGGILRSAANSVLSGLAGEVAKESGAGPVGQAIAEVAGSGFGGIGRKKILPTKSQKDLVEHGRKFGLTEEQITPAIQKQSKINRLSPIAHKGRATVEKILESKRSIGSIYEKLKSTELGQAKASPEFRKDLLSEINKELTNLPSQTRKHIAEDLVDLKKSGYSGEGLINFYQDLNKYYGKGLRELAPLQKTISNSLEKVYGKDFALTNKLYANNLKLGIRLRPDLAEQFHNMREGAELAYGIVSGNTSLIQAALGEFAGRRLISRMLTNPRYQNLTKKIYEEVSNGRYAAAQKALNLLLEENEED